jgi:hypothetical protein
MQQQKESRADHEKQFLHTMDFKKISDETGKVMVRHFTS